MAVIIAWASAATRNETRPLVRHGRLLLPLILLTVCCCGCRDDASNTIPLEFWTFGSEGEIVGKLIQTFESEHPDIRVNIQQIPWTAGHEKLVTAFAGDRLPDVCQLGNTWIPEFAALGALQPLNTLVRHSAVIHEADYFPGIWQTNCIGEQILGVPWYVDTRLIFYRKDLLAAAGYSTPPRTWSEWRACLEAVQAQMPPGGYAILLPINEWEPIAVLGVQSPAGLLRDQGTHGNFRSPEFKRAFEFYTGIYQSQCAPVIGATQISNQWQEFAAGRYAMYLTGPWNVSQFRANLPADQVANWATMPMPSPDQADRPGNSLAGGCSLVLFKSARNNAAAWKLVEFLSQESSQLRLFELLGNLPAKRAAWEAPELAHDEWIDAFRRQLEFTKPAAKVPEWERIAMKLAESAERVVRGQEEIESVLTDLDDQVDRLLEKRRWMLTRQEQATR